MVKRRAIFHINIAIPKQKNMRGLVLFLEKAAQLTLQQLPRKFRKAAEYAEFTLLLAPNSEVCRLNRNFRGIDKVTNVLSFPYFPRTQIKRLAKDNKGFYAGDIAIAYRYAVSEARKDKKKPDHHIVHLFIHGILHLFGYDHLTPAAAARMELLERKIMKKLGLPEPYPVLTRKRLNKKTSTTVNKESLRRKIWL